MAKILVIDDLPLNRQFMTKLLGSQHYDLCEAADGAEGLRMAQEERPDLIISDVLMPTMNGYDFVRRLREDPEIGKTPVIFSTALYLSHESQALAERCGVTSIIYQPCEAKAVLDIVAAALRDKEETNAAGLVADEESADQLLSDKLAQKTYQLRDANAKLTALIELSYELAEERDPVALLDHYCSVAREVVGARWGLVVLLEPNRKTVQHFGVVGIELEDTPAVRSTLLKSGIFKTVVREGRTVCLSDVTSISAALRLPRILPRAESLLVAPLSLREQVYGWICLADKLGLESFSEQDQQLVLALAAKMAVAYDNARLYSESTKYAVKLEAEIAERERAERELNESQARLAGIIGSATDAIVTLDSEHRVVMFNEAAERMFRRAAHEAVGKEIFHFIPAGFRSDQAPPTPALDATGPTTPIMAGTRTVYGLRSDGEAFPLEASISKIEVAGQALYTVIMRDITERERAEKVLADLTQQLQLALQVARMGVWHWNLQDDTVTAIQGAGPLSGLPEGFYPKTGEAFNGLIHPDDRPLVAESLRRALEMGEMYQAEFRLVLPDRGVRWVSARGQCSRDAAGQPLAMIGVDLDITERKLVEEAVQTSEARYHTLFEYAPDGILIADHEGDYIDANASMCRMLGYTHAELLRLNSSDIVSPAETEHIKPALKLLATGSDYHREWQFLRKDGSVFQAEVIGTGMPDGNILAMTRDITERKKAEEELKAANQRLERTLVELQVKREELAGMTQQLWQASKLAMMGELAASIAHELNNPLATVSLRTESLLMQIPADQDWRRPLEIISQEVDRMATLVDNLLQFSRRSHRQISTVDAHEEIVTSVDFIHYHLRSHKIEVICEFSASLPTIQADRQQLRQLFLNLLTNASDAMPLGGKLTIRTSLTQFEGADAVAIEFADSGEGILSENLKKIWEPFFTTKPEGKGTGLGLAICRRIAEEHGGTIEAESEFGKGTTITIVMPATNGRGGEFYESERYSS